MHNILVTGGTGQLGRAIMAEAQNNNKCYYAPSREVLDICDTANVERYISEHNTSLVINCAAYTDVEGAERDEQGAYLVNSEAVAALADVCHRHNIRLIHISTDYVFGGDTERDTPYGTDDTTAPINCYGRSKADGERHILQYDEHIIIRTSWLYSPWGKNFCRTILRLAAEQPTLRVVNDQHGTPTSALSLARFIVVMIATNGIDKMSGIYHMTDGGECTWYDFAQEIVRLGGIDCHIEPCTSAERATLAQRPNYSVLDNSRTEAIYPQAIRGWQEALVECIDHIKNEV